MSPLVDRATLESVFNADDLVTLDEATLVAVAHEPTRDFLRDVGLPDQAGWFEVAQDLLDGNLRIGGAAWEAVAARYPSRAYDMSTWLTLGGVGLDDVIIDVATGIVYCIPDDGSPHRLNSGVDALVLFLCELEKERPEYDPEAATEEGVDPEGSAERLLHRMRRADPSAMADPGSSWYAVLRLVRRLLQSY
ncbi:SUKH-4 family immunity protein [Micromonospora krabiensis]|uniref:SUKH-4 immunity protein n=1 Tax=Micromonospora krabiensis TaxID=307121 RepID=A0A1C3N1F2_9ACTN|nr:SUKH-4 family immunity protein [Micromonospora krabiensis]SBV26422.1 SUKH-4 immunity protein [Micromonospora krabiensis]